MARPGALEVLEPKAQTAEAIEVLAQNRGVCQGVLLAKDEQRRGLVQATDFTEFCL